MNVPIPSTLVALATLLLVPHDAFAQSGGNPGQFGGAPPGQFDPNAIPGRQPSAAPPGQFDPNAIPGAQPSTQPSRPGQFDPNAIPGGSASPGAPFSGPPDPNDPNTNLDAAKEEDSGRGITWFWAEVGGGFEHVGLQTLHNPERSNECLGTVQNATCARADSVAGEISTTGTGPMVEGGLGARLLFFTIGARGRLGFFQHYDLATVGGELGFRIPIGAVEPRFSVGGGYAATMSGNSATGGYARLGGGLDYFVASNLAIGGDLSGQIVGLNASILESSTNPEDAATILSSVGGTGLGVALGLHVGLHL